MKIQIQSQRVRLRIDENELANLLAGEAVESRTRMGDLGELVYVLRLHAAAEASVVGTLSATEFHLPRQDIVALQARLPCRDGLSFDIPAPLQDLQLQFDVDVRDSVRQRGVQRRGAGQAVQAV
ncbi:MAG: DUF7009 family protein [Stenotrophomonas sp.]